ncbi:unnamed protein product [Heligmosomoides polygyrus]|uniref:Cysteine-rich DPF motif domain-containing protein 1 n=1 Tax=Heligmosomoides polygyrus TaxID=6339 RepID=A0A183GTE9_HELPZ|nr:unnamed protein product [Heligmosomoides polygyrus]
MVLGFFAPDTIPELGENSIRPQREPRAPVAAADAPETESVEQSQKAEQQSEDLSNVEPFVQFNCSICGLSEKCFFGDLKALDGFYPSPVFYMRDPFLPPRRVKGRKLQLSDFLVLGSSCSLCSQSVCLDKACSVYFGTLFCTTCIIRERRRFPETVLQVRDNHRCC